MKVYARAELEKLAQQFPAKRAHSKYNQRRRRKAIAKRVDNISELADQNLHYW